MNKISTSLTYRSDKIQLHRMGMSNQLVPHFWRLLLSRGALKYFISDFAKIMKKHKTLAHVGTAVF